VPTPYNACFDLLDRRILEGAGKRPAVVTRSATVTYAELLDSVQRAAGGLAGIGVQAEQRVAMVVLDSIEFYQVFLGAMRIGAVPVPVNPLLPARDLAAIIAASRARVLVISPEKGGEIAAISAGAPDVGHIIVAGSPEWDALLTGERMQTPRDTWDESPGFWLCTSGSTGSPSWPCTATSTCGPATKPTAPRSSAWAPAIAAIRWGRCSTPTGWATRSRSPSP